MSNNDERPAVVCLVPDCGRTCDKGQHARGMCGPCYQEARRAVNAKETTWLALQNLGLATIPERKQYPKKQTPFVAALERAQAASNGEGGTMSEWFRVDADYGDGWVLVGEVADRIGYLALADRAYKDGAKNVRVYRCESVGGE